MQVDEIKFDIVKLEKSGKPEQATGNSRSRGMRRLQDAAEDGDAKVANGSADAARPLSAFAMRLNLSRIARQPNPFRHMLAFAAFARQPKRVMN